MDILSPLAESPFNTTSTATTTADPKSTTDGAATTATGGLRRKNTLKAYLANKNKLKERQAINVIVDPSVLQREDSSGSEHEADSKTPFSPNSPTNLMSPVSGKRIDTDLETLDDEKKAIEDQLAAVTQQLNGKSPSSSAPSSPTAGATSNITGATSGSPFEAADEAALIEKRTRLCAELDSIIKRRRELLQSWARDYKNLKRSGSLAKRQEDLFWVTTA
ncbi:hypothetical protein BKA57DRAFT_448887 [Linnemannia elongata]|uniref:Uncharacterized protein n=1 Tax=Linnemannia elongata AG-77 TaxID=1314771 RepID=A0A197K165_9FUNG|nr:hypothetical protein BGZ88_003535 [Linnemannia elongata]OAQ30953.1 hypothetical protein K457DRAFT_136588 [Linnemannia elongata AG-77]KAF9338649.1 hypothetical protein BGZ91_008296 [Linnemannia elongata]KAG0059241.1 hypothetical protein BGZ89_000552 [Linnemannia elongata]KAG0080909.1 hypothetical protein BGZ90_010860 [Linnemannia elongata]